MEIWVPEAGEYVIELEPQLERAVANERRSLRYGLSEKKIAKINRTCIVDHEMESGAFDFPRGASGELWDEDQGLSFYMWAMTFTLNRGWIVVNADADTFDKPLQLSADVMEQAFYYAQVNEPWPLISNLSCLHPRTLLTTLHSKGLNELPKPQRDQIENTIRWCALKEKASALHITAYSRQEHAYDERVFVDADFLRENRRFLRKIVAHSNW